LQPSRFFRDVTAEDANAAGVGATAITVVTTIAVGITIGATETVT